MIKIKEDHLKYDEIPYRCYSFNYCSPETLRSIGVLFGMTPPLLKTARVLEIGCSEGVNLFRFAESYPKSFTLGIELSKIKIQNGQNIIDQLNLKNIQLKDISITELDESYGKFDYIICNCVFSWVSSFVRNSILEVSKKLLNKKGVVFINYSALPGWNMINTIRELILFHTSNITDINDKIQQAKLIINFIHESLEEQNTAYAQLIRIFTELITSNDDYSLYWEYLSETNQAYYLHEFIDKAKIYGFKYLGDSNVEQMYVGNLPKKTVDTLRTITDNIKLEQYIDFFKNTSTRYTLLCHQDTVLSRNISRDILAKFYYYCNITLKDPESSINLTSNSLVTFYLNGLKENPISSTTPAIKAILMTFFKNQANPILINEIIIRAKKFLPQVSDVEIQENIFINFPDLIFKKVIKFISDKPNNISIISKKPKISKFSQWQIQQTYLDNTIVITNALNEVVTINTDQINIVKLLDGKHTIKQIKNMVLESLKKREIITKNNLNIQNKDRKMLEFMSNKLVDNTLEGLRKNFCLVV